MQNCSHFTRSVLVSLLIFLMFSTKIFTQGTAGEFTNKLQSIINKTEQIHDVFQDIAVQLNNEGAPGFDKIVDLGEKMKERIDSLRNKISSLTDLFSLEKLNILKNTVKVDSQNIWHNNWRFDIPQIELKVESSNNSPDRSPIPKFKPFLLNFLDLVDKPLDNLLQHANALRDSINSNLAIAKSHARQKYLMMEGSFPDAEYWYPDVIRETLGRPGVVLTLKEVSVFSEEVKEILNAFFEQVISLLGEGGNLASLKSLPPVIVKLLEALKEAAEHVEGEEGFNLNEGSYARLEYLHEEIDTLQKDFRDWVTLSIRTRIEINLAGHGDHPHPIAIFQLPAQYGGYLELARDIVQETINDMLSAGENVYQAQLFFRRGNDEFLASHYKKAFDWYSKSYDEATK